MKPFAEMTVDELHAALQDANTSRGRSMDYEEIAEVMRLLEEDMKKKLKPIGEMTFEELSSLKASELDEVSLLQAMRRLEKLAPTQKNGNYWTGDLTKLNEVAQVEGVEYNWVWGKIDGYFFEAKVFAENSDFGINKGRISKLCIRRGNAGDAEQLVNYDRGWDVKPNQEVTATYNKLLKAFE